MTGLWIVWPSLITVGIFWLASHADEVAWPELEDGELPPPRTAADWFDDFWFAAIISAVLWLYTLAARLLP